MISHHYQYAREKGCLDNFLIKQKIIKRHSTVSESSYIAVTKVVPYFYLIRSKEDYELIKPYMNDPDYSFEREWFDPSCIFPNFWEYDWIGLSYYKPDYVIICKNYSDYGYRDLSEAYFYLMCRNYKYKFVSEFIISPFNTSVEKYSDLIGDVNPIGIYRNPERDFPKRTIPFLRIIEYKDSNQPPLFRARPKLYQDHFITEFEVKKFLSWIPTYLSTLDKSWNNEIHGRYVEETLKEFHSGNSLWRWSR